MASSQINCFDLGQYLTCQLTCVNHFGQPDVWEFDYEFFAPRWPPLTT